MTMVDCACCALELTRCYLPTPAPAPAFFKLLDQLPPGGGRVAAGANKFTFPNFAGSGVTATVGVTGGETLTPATSSAGQVDVLLVGVSPPPKVFVHVTFSQPVFLRRIGMTDLDFAQEDAHTFSPQETGVYGQKLFRPCQACMGAAPSLNPLGCVHDSAGSGSGGVTFPAPKTTSLDFIIDRCGSSGAGSYLTELGFDLVSPLRGAVAMTCGPTVHWYDVATGVEVPAANLVPCPAG